jgi:hypothetical protein
MASAPIAATGWLAHVSCHVTPPLVVRKTPPSAAPM